MEKAYMKHLHINKGFTIWELMIVFAIIGILAAMAVPNRRPHRGDYRKKACFSNMRVLQGALEMYNMDVNTMMREMNDENQKILMEGKYLKIKEPYVCPETYEKGHYLSEGDLTEDGVMYCTYHGTLEGIKITPGMTLREYKEAIENRKREEERAEFEKQRKELFAKIAIGGGILGFISLILVLSPSPKKKNA